MDAITQAIEYTLFMYCAKRMTVRCVPDRIDYLVYDPHKQITQTFETYAEAYQELYKEAI